MQRDFKGIWIPKEIWISTDLKVMEKLLLVEIDSLDNADGCFASNDYFAKFFSLSKNRCSEIIKSLEEKGYIAIEYIYHDDSKAISKRVIRCIRNFDRPIRKIEGGYSENRQTYSKNRRGYSENCEDNNTFNNTFNNNYDVDNTRARKNEMSQQNVYHFYQENFGILTPILGEKLADWIKDLGEDVVKEALTRTLMNGTRSFKYAEAIMKEWYHHNIKSLEQVKALDLEYQAKKVKGNQKTKRPIRQEIVPSWLNNQETTHPPTLQENATCMTEKAKWLWDEIQKSGPVK